MNEQLANDRHIAFSLYYFPFFLFVVVVVADVSVIAYEFFLVVLVSLANLHIRLSLNDNEPLEPQILKPKNKLNQHKQAQQNTNPLTSKRVRYTNKKLLRKRDF